MQIIYTDKTTPPVDKPAKRNGLQPQPDRGSLPFDSLSGAQFEFTGLVGERVEANVNNWLLRAPQANPGMLEMFRLRDRRPAPQLVPWAAEFVGKYLISAIQALRLTEDSRLQTQVSNVVAAFIATQAEDGYLGPFPKGIRLLKNWDLWGHYHALEALASRQRAILTPPRPSRRAAPSPG